MKRWVLVLPLVALTGACGEFSAPAREQAVVLSIAPVFDAASAALADNADMLHIRVERDSQGTFRQVKDTTVSIDPATGEANVDITVVALQNPQLFRIIMEAVRSSDGAVLFSGTADVSVTPGSGASAPPISIPVAYGGPKGVQVVIAPRDTGVAPGGTFTYRATVLDATSNSVAEPVGFYLVNAADASKLTLNRLSGVANALAGASGSVLVRALTAGGLADTTSVFIGALPAGVRITPGFATVGASQSRQLTGTVVDVSGNPVTTQTALTWDVEDQAVATTSSTGLITGVAVGTTKVYATYNQFKDSIWVVVPVTGNVVVSATGGGTTFASPKVGDIVTVIVTADMSLTATPAEKLGSYHATLGWDPAQMVLVDVLNSQSGDFPTPVSNSTGAGQLQLAQADAAGKAGAVVVARVRLRALAAGDAGLTIVVSEMSAPSPTFTNFFAASRITGVSGPITVRP